MYKAFIKFYALNLSKLIGWTQIYDSIHTPMFCLLNGEGQFYKIHSSNQVEFFILHSRFRFCLKMILAGLKILSFNDQEYFSLKIIMFSSNLKDFIAQVDGQKEHYKMF